MPPDIFTTRRPSSDNPPKPIAIAGEERLEKSTLTGAKAHPLTATIRSAIDVVKGRLIRDYGYDEESATDVLNYVASIFARGDTKESK